MSKRRSSVASPLAGRSVHRRIIANVLAVLAAVLLLAAGSRIGAMVARYMALHRMSLHEFGPARPWLAWSAWLAPSDYRNDVLAAAVARHWSDRKAWTKSLEQAKRKGAPHDGLVVELKLGQFQGGGLYEGAETEMAELTAAGASQSDVITAFLLGYLARGDTAGARGLLNLMAGYSIDEAQQEFLWGVYLCHQEDLGAAEMRLRSALATQPSHELARAQLAALLQREDRIGEALREYVDLAIRSAGNKAATLGVVRALRQMARLGDARAALAPLNTQSDLDASVQLEMAMIELESGNYDEAQRQFSGMRPEEVTDAVFIPAALTLSLCNKPLEAEPWFTKAGFVQNRSGWIYDLRMRLAKAPGDVAATEKLRRLSQPPALADLWAPLPDPAAQTSPVPTTSELYRVHCSGCHGARGDGRGRAARHLFPRPRDLRGGMCQLVSTRNGVPSLEDIQKVLAQGMAGTVMQPFDVLSEADRRLLAQEVQRLRREGVREEVAKALRDEGESIDEAEVRQAVERSTTPGEPVRLPAHWPAPGQMLAKGKARFVTLGCAKCHGEDGAGSADQALFDDFGEPARPRDLAHEPFKGGHQPESIYLRIAAGMPGTADPAILNLPEQEGIELVDYIRSLAHGPEYLLTNHQRRSLAATTAYLNWLNSSMP